MAVTKATTFAPAQISANAGARTGAAGFIACALFLAIVWVEVISHLQVEWSQNPQYKYAWSVPFLTIYLVWKRWLERPQPDAGNRL